MNMRSTVCLLLSAILLLAVPATIHAEVTTDPLLDYLVEKGVLTPDEAKEVRTRAEQERRRDEAAAFSGGRQQVRERLSSLRAALRRLERTSITGYIQARALLQDDGETPSTDFVPIGSLSVTHTTGRGQFALSTESSRNSFMLQDAYFRWFITPTGERRTWTLRGGQFLRPFGFAVERYPADREFPTLPAGWVELFPGGWDQGANLIYEVNETTRAELALLNGDGARPIGEPFGDSDNHKDVLARFWYSPRGARLDLALSGYLGRQSVGDGAGGGRISGDRNRWGIGAVYGAGKGVFRGEFVHARELARGLGPEAATGSATARAYYAQYMHSLGRGYRVGVRYGSFDPDTRDRFRLGGDGELRVPGLIALRNIGENTRLTLAWEELRTTTYNSETAQSSEQRARVITLQGQYAF